MRAAREDKVVRAALAAASAARFPQIGAETRAVVKMPLCVSLSPSRLTPQHWEVASSAQGGRQGEHAPSVEKAV